MCGDQFSQEVMDRALALVPESFWDNVIPKPPELPACFIKCEEYDGQKGLRREESRTVR